MMSCAHKEGIEMNLLTEFHKIERVAKIGKDIVGAYENLPAGATAANLTAALRGICDEVDNDAELAATPVKWS